MLYRHPGVSESMTSTAVTASPF